MGDNRIGLFFCPAGLSTLAATGFRTVVPTAAVFAFVARMNIMDAFVAGRPGARNWRVAMLTCFVSHLGTSLVFGLLLGEN